ncbi:myotubularin-associated protein, putative [Bodo saltans]|uniref:Myotubularin-associated protein, putative n=1 Tax=Bodo saltans TaxID=75058 RepID=A0A0S4JSJ7_BODSA|nr:myotubularin-associated protein, putative [Bodo saltans]|eukprot:CUG94460.1 myotubularin-associated protein, putative [Bodo saltans]
MSNRIASSHSVVEQLQAFRYVATTREVPWKEIRGVDLGKLRVHLPDLQLLKHLTSCLSDCALPSLTELQNLSPSESLQLLGAFQALLQFSLHSQTVLRHQVSAKQTALSVEKITSQQMSALEARLELAKKKLDDAATEREATRITFHNMEKQIVELRTANGLLERELEFHRNTQRLITASKSASEPCLVQQQQLQPVVQRNSGAEPRHLVDLTVVPPTQQQQVLPKAEKSRSRRQEGTDSATSTLWDEEGAEQRRSAHHRHRSSSGARSQRPPAAAARHADGTNGQFVDWQSFATLLMKQQQQPQWAPSAAHSPTSPSAAVVLPQPTVEQHRPSSHENDASLRRAAELAAEQQNVHHERQLQEMMKALSSGLEANRVQLLKQTQETMGNVEAGITHRITKLQQEQRAMQDALSTQVSQNETQFSQAVQKLSTQMSSLKADTEDQLRVLKGDVSSAISSISRQTSVAANNSSAQLEQKPVATVQPQPSHTTAVPSAFHNQRSMSPNVLPPLPLTQIQQDLNNTSGAGGGGVYGKHGSPIGTPGSVFGPRVMSATVSHSGDRHSSSDDDDEADSPYVPMSKQTTAPVSTIVLPSPVPTPSGKIPGTPVASTAAAASSAAAPSETPLPIAATTSLNVSGLDTSTNLTRKASSQLLKDTQDELQRLLDEEAAFEEAKKARLAEK